MATPYQPMVRDAQPTRRSSNHCGRTWRRRWSRCCSTSRPRGAPTRASATSAAASASRRWRPTRRPTSHPQPQTRSRRWVITSRVPEYRLAVAHLKLQACTLQHLLPRLHFWTLWSRDSSRNFLQRHGWSLACLDEDLAGRRHVRIRTCTCVIGPLVAEFLSVCTLARAYNVCGAVQCQMSLQAPLPSCEAHLALSLHAGGGGSGHIQQITGGGGQAGQEHAACRVGGAAARAGRHIVAMQLTVHTRWWSCLWVAGVRSGIG